MCTLINEILRDVTVWNMAVLYVSLIRRELNQRKLIIQLIYDNQCGVSYHFNLFVVVQQYLSIQIYYALQHYIVQLSSYIY